MVCFALDESLGSDSFVVPSRWAPRQHQQDFCCNAESLYTDHDQMVPLLLLQMATVTASERICILAVGEWFLGTVLRRHTVGRSLFLSHLPLA